MRERRCRTHDRRSLGGNMGRSVRRLLPVVLAIALVGAACDDDDSAASGTTAAAGATTASSASSGGNAPSGATVGTATPASVATSGAKTVLGSGIPSGDA